MVPRRPLELVSCAASSPSPLHPHPSRVLRASDARATLDISTPRQPSLPLQRRVWPLVRLVPSTWSTAFLQSRTPGALDRHLTMIVAPPGPGSSRVGRLTFPSAPLDPCSSSRRDGPLLLAHSRLLLLVHPRRSSNSHLPSAPCASVQCRVTACGVEFLLSFSFSFRLSCRSILNDSPPPLRFDTGVAAEPRARGHSSHSSPLHESRRAHHPVVAHLISTTVVGLRLRMPRLHRRFDLRRCIITPLQPTAARVRYPRVRQSILLFPRCCKISSATLLPSHRKFASEFTLCLRH